MTVARVVERTGGAVGRQVWTWCPGCDSLHPWTVESDGVLNGGVTWDWDLNLEAPTFSPSLLVHDSVHLCEPHPPLLCPDPHNCGAPGHAVLPDGSLGHASPHTASPAFGDCHSFLRAGVWEFLPDSAHHLAGTSHPMVPLRW